MKQIHITITKEDFDNADPNKGYYSDFCPLRHAVLRQAPEVLHDGIGRATLLKSTTPTQINPWRNEIVGNFDPPFTYKEYDDVKESLAQGINTEFHTTLTFV